MQPTKIHFRLSQDDDGYPPVGVESVWAVPSANADEFLLDNVPFFANQATLGDRVLARQVDGNRWLERLLEPSENSLIRVVFLESTHLDAVKGRLAELRCSTEYLGAHSLLAVSIPRTTSLADVQEFLREQAASGGIDYEEPILRQ